VFQVDGPALLNAAFQKPAFRWTEL